MTGEPLYAHNKGPGAWLNPAAFSLRRQAFGSFGDLGRNSLRADWFKNIDLSLFKQFPINERYRVEFRFESSISSTPQLGILRTRLFGPDV